MSVLIASSLRKEFAGDPLFAGVSFSVGRRDRLSLAGANGAGKTTLLRAIAGETSLQGGELAFAKGTRVALHDQRPPRRARLHAPRVRAVRSARPARGRGRAPAARGGDGGRRPRRGRRSAATPTRRHASSTPEAGRGATVSPRPCAGSASPSATSTGALGTFSGGELTRASLARALAGEPGPAPPRRADEPPRRREPRVARARARVARRRGHPRRPRPLVPRGRDDVGARALAGRRALLRRAVARVAAREGRARGSRRGRPPSASPTTSLASSASSQRFRLQEVEGEAGAGQAHADRPAREGAGRRRRDARGAHDAAGGRSASTSSSRRAPGKVVLEADGTRLAAGDKLLLEDAGLAIERGEKVGARRPERSGQDDAPRGAARVQGARPRDLTPRARRRARLLLPAHAGAPEDGLGAGLRSCGDGAPATAGADAARPLPLLGLGDARARR